jgi:hypothetical protein
MDPVGAPPDFLLVVFDIADQPGMELVQHELGLLDCYLCSWYRQMLSRITLAAE